MKRPYRFHTLALLIALVGLLISSCGAGQANLTPTISIGMLQTQAVSTLAAELTQTALAVPPPTPTSTPTLAPTNTATATRISATANPAAGGSSGSTACYGLTWAADVTVPDNTVMTQGQAFVKTWQVLNTGTCTWEVGFTFNFVGGSAMEGVTYTLSIPVPAGASIEISVPMIAPVSDGTFKGNWRMSTASGVPFGDTLYVIIVVGGTATPTP